jgi:hypothetical protein
MRIVDEDKLILADKRLKDKKKRFDTRYEVETFYRNKSLEQNEKNQRKKLCNDAIKESDTRGYNIVNGNETKTGQFRFLTKDPWSKLVDCSGEKNTFMVKEIYKHPYDYSDLIKTEKKFKKERKSIIFI